MIRFLVLLIFVAISINGLCQEFSIIEKPLEKKLDVLYNGKFLTSYCYFDSTEKPILFPIRTISGISVTRGYPIAPNPGERSDHPHHTGLWLNYESVNDLDFWNNSDAISQDKKSHYGSIKHEKILSKESGNSNAKLITSSSWVDQEGKVLLREVTKFTFFVNGQTFVIDRSSSLTGVEEKVVFKDVKDGMLGLRVARELELPSQEEGNFVDARGNITTIAKASNTGVTGMYKNREGIEGDDTWGKRSAWTLLTGKKDGEIITIGIIDHPSNIGYPTYWHARGYGLFAANPLGQKIFSNGKEERNFSLVKDQSVSFKYRILIHSGSELTTQEMDKFMKAFAATK